MAAPGTFLSNNKGTRSLCGQCEGVGVVSSGRGSAFCEWCDGKGVIDSALNHATSFDNSQMRNVGELPAMTRDGAPMEQVKRRGRPAKLFGE